MQIALGSWEEAEEYRPHSALWGPRVEVRAGEQRVPVAANPSVTLVLTF